MYIDRDKLAEDLTLRECIQKIIKKSSINMLKESFPEQYQEHLNEGKLRESIRQLLPRLLSEEMSNSEAEDVAISFVKKTLLDTIKIVNAGQSEFKNPGVQDGHIKYVIMALRNDLEENHGEEGAVEKPTAEEDEQSVIQEFADNEDDIIDIKVSPKDDPMFISDEEEEEDSEEEPLDPKQNREDELYLTLTDEEKVGFRYARDNTWPQVTKQVKRVHKQVMGHPKIAKYYEEWLIKNFKLHGENTKEEMPLKDETSFEA